MGVGSSPNASVVAVESITKALVNWYRVVRSSLIIGENTPAAHITEYGIAVSLAFGAPLASANLVASSRMVSAGLVGTSHAWPYARSSAATAASVRAQSAIDVQLCGTFSGPG